MTENEIRKDDHEDLDKISSIGSSGTIEELGPEETVKTKRQLKRTRDEVSFRGENATMNTSLPNCVTVPNEATKTIKKEMRQFYQYN